ncbi:hypothetical protein SNOG_12437 [Parastagonospora nodorum SN15]|uniref:Uncharacterized protein n=1 Tax=Phaeosphaeria nodorum (strain SN15 / ATCC MYA-4574 / FGSC 10173) TaxID=321614 RepID=Q0U727_PHANO|nr:hypothetical protein SNOG_12437 [Parastagonospora nodorum SN15]EAT80250.1 hypothetical protein SNOG_12437 [Parastagonospora nodorum SN15]
MAKFLQQRTTILSAFTPYVHTTGSTKPVETHPHSPHQYTCTLQTPISTPHVDYCQRNRPISTPISTSLSTLVSTPSRPVLVTTPPTTVAPDANWLRTSSR